MGAFGLLDEGSGEPVIWLHSSGTSRRQWRRTLDVLSTGYRHLALDLWGYGETPMPECSGDFSLDDEAELVERLFERLDGPCRLVGHSYGGAVALKVAQRNPGRVASVFAYEPVLFHLLHHRTDATAELAEITAISDRTRQLVEHRDLNGASETFVRYWSGDRAWDSLPAESRQRLAEVAPKAACDFSALDCETGSPETYLTPGVSIRIAAGERSPAPARKVSAILTESRTELLEVLPSLTHMAPITHPGPVLDAIRRHWRASPLNPA